MSFIVGGRDASERVLVVAEIGNNHEGDVKVARELVRAAAASGADAVKFQTFRTEHFVAPTDPARVARLRRFQLSNDDFVALADDARSHGLRFLSTPLDLGSATFLEGLVDAFKVASGDIDFVPLLRQVARSGKPLIVSTGASELAEVERAVAHIEDAWGARRAQLALLHCVSSYPAPQEQANLRAIPALAKAFPRHTVGYSDHTIGIEACVLAVALGARVLEKHFTLDHHHSDFRDHLLSAEPEELKALVQRVRAAEAMLGNGAKRPQPCEAPMLPAIRRSVRAARGLRAGTRLAFEDLAWLRPGGDLAPGHENRLVGRTLRRDVEAGAPLLPGDVE